MKTTDQVAGEAREKLARAGDVDLDTLCVQLRSLSTHLAIYSDEKGLASIAMDQAARVIAALRAQPERGTEEWNYDMDAAPSGPDVSVLVTVPSLHAGWPPIVGEAWYCADGAGEGWWWSGSTPSDYHSSPIRDTNAEPIAWRRLPEAAAIRALPLHPVKDEGGGR